MPTLLELSTIEATALVCQRNNLSFIELNMNLPDYQAHAVDLKRFQNIRRDYRLDFTFHLEESFNPFDFNRLVRAAHMKTVKDTVRLAGKLEAKILNMHMSPGIYFTLPDRKTYLFEHHLPLYLDAVKGFRDELSYVLAEEDISISIENCGDFATRPYIARALELLLECDCFSLTFDIGHNASANYSDEPVINQYVDRLKHFHIHDELDGNNHLALGEGNINLPYYLKIAEQLGCRAVVEVKTLEGLERSICWLTEHGMIDNKN
ncbi:MAG: sugar phosphate isomerase/epimerase [Oscillospiraceae bacterium]|nr:sugar phosphate isomerase/epimerase [Oscillospiraceae bacterium]